MNPIVVRDEDARDLLVKFLGLTVHRLDTGRTEVYVGTPGHEWVEKVS